MDGEDEDALGEHMEAVAQDAKDLGHISQLDSRDISFKSRIGIPSYIPGSHDAGSRQLKPCRCSRME